LRPIDDKAELYSLSSTRLTEKSRIRCNQCTPITTSSKLETKITDKEMEDDDDEFLLLRSYFHNKY